MEKNKLSKTNKIPAAESAPELLSDIRRLIVEAKQSVITTVNATQTML